MTSTYYYCSAQAPIASGATVPLIDVSTLVPEVIPDASHIGEVLINQGTFTVTGANGKTTAAISTLSVGWSGNTDALLPASAGITTTGLSGSRLIYVRSGLLSPTIGPQALLLTSSSAITTGTITVIVKVTNF